MNNRARCLSVLALLAGCIAVTQAHAGNMSFLADTPLKYFSQADMDLMRENARKVLDAPGASARQSWASERSGVSGWAQVRSEFTATDGAPCKRLRVVNRAKGLESDATYTVCKTADRGWIFNADAAPAR